MNWTGSKKNLELSVEQKRLLIDPEYAEIPIFKQCELLGLARSSFYYQPIVMDDYNLLLMRLIDEQYTQTPFYGILRMTACLRSMGHEVNHKRIGRLMRLMGLQAIYPKPNTSKAMASLPAKYPYLLKGLFIARPNHVWSTDITYIRLKQGFVYLVAVMDWFSRYVLSWEVSNSLDASFCLSALEKAFVKERKLLLKEFRRYSTAIKGVSSPVLLMSVALKHQEFASVGMDEVEQWIISL